MAYGIGAGGFLGIALETVPNTYVAPTRFIPIVNESLNHTQDTQWRRVLRQTASVMGAVPGDVSVSGDISMEALSGVLPYFLLAARTSVVKTPVTPATPPYEYVFTPTDQATASKTLSITVVRNGAVFGFVGCVVSNFNFSVDAGRLMFNPSIVGSDEASQSLPVPAWMDDVPYGAGHYDIEIPTGTPVLDADTFTFTVENNAEPQFRLKSTGRGAQFMKYGENNVTASMERDFQNRTEFDNYKALMEESITMTATNAANDSVSLVLPAAIKSEYGLGLSGQGDLLRMALTYQGVLDATGKPYEITVNTDEDVVVA